MDRNQELEEQVRRLTETVDGMRGRMARLEGREATSESDSKGSDRRGFLRLGAGAVLGALGWAAVKAVPASAATGGNLVLGSANLAENATTLQADGGIPPVQVLGVEAAGTTGPGVSGTFAGPLQGLGASGFVEGVDGWAAGLTAYAVYGLTDAGTGVVGESNTGIGLYAARSGRIRQDGLHDPGLPGYTPNLYEQVRDANGILWIHNATGTWRRVNTLRVDTANGSGAAYQPFRRLDTRNGGAARKAAGTLTPVSIAGQGTGASAIPADAVAAVGNLTAAAWTGGGYLAIMPAGITIGTGAGQFNPAVGPSSLNFLTGQSAIANSFICGLSGGALQVYVGGSASHFIVDITGYIQ
jgi:hypothetical protein